MIAAYCPAFLTSVAKKRAGVFTVWTWMHTVSPLLGNHTPVRLFATTIVLVCRSVLLLSGDGFSATKMNDVDNHDATIHRKMPIMTRKTISPTNPFFLSSGFLLV